MDVDNLRAELETHLKNNPHKDAPGGFRDRFDAYAEQYAAGDDDVPKSVMEEQLVRVRNDAEAAANAAAGDAAPDMRIGASPPRAAAPKKRGPADGDPAPDVRPGDSSPARRESSGADEAALAAAPAAAPGFLQGYGIVLVAILAVLVGAFFYFR